MWNLYEDPWLLLIAGILGLIIGVWIRRNVSDKKGAWVILIGVLTAAGGLGLDFWVKTDYEQIERVIDTCRDASVARDIRPIISLVAPSSQAPVRFNRDIFIASIQSAIEAAAVSSIRFSEVTIDVFQGSGRAALNAAVFLDPQSSYAAAGGLFFVEMDVDFRKIDNRWLVSGVEVKKVNNDRVTWKPGQ